MVKESDVFDISTIQFGSLAEASEFISKLRTLIKARGSVTVMEALCLSDSECLSKSVKDMHYGWKSVDSAEVNVSISLPTPVDLFEDGGDI